MSAAVHISHASQVTIAAARGGVRVGTGRAAFFLSAPAVVTLAAAALRVTLSPAPRLVVIGGRQGIAGPPGPIGPPPSVINSLESSSTAAALAANQGRVIDGKITQVRTDYGSHETDFAAQFSSMIS
jgi:hypothetical protein